jgi:hypothetical protein
MARFGFCSLSRVAGLPLAAFLAGCGPPAYNTAPASSFLLTCTRPGASVLVLRLDTGAGRFTVVNADGAPDGAVTTTPYAYALAAARWTGKVNRYDGQLVIVRAPAKTNAMPPINGPAPPLAAPTELWSCSSSADKAKF